MSWGYYGGEPPCEHLLALRKFLEDNSLEIYSEHGQDPDGWVNIHCKECYRTYETVLQAPWDDLGQKEE